MQDPHSVSPEIVLDFLKKTLPFQDLAHEDLERLSRECTIDFVPNETMVLQEGKTEVNSLFLIQKGGVKMFIRDENGRESLVDFRGEGASVGALALIKDGVANMNVETVEDTFFFKLRKKTFLDLVNRRPGIAGYYLKAFSEDLVSKAFSELRTRKEAVPADSSLYLFTARIGDLSHRAPVSISMGSTIQEAAARMVREGVGSLLITDPSADIVGIVTDTDLRKAVSVGMDYEAPIEIIMSTPVYRVGHQEICFDALMQMMTRQLHHLAVEQEGRVTGMVTSHDIMVIQGKSPMSLFREIMAQQHIEDLYPLGERIPHVIRTLIDEGAKASNITRMITVLNDLLLEKLLTLLLKQLGKPPAPFCWLLMGSEGRREQTFKTDQDNALVYKDLQDDILQRAADVYFTAFAERAIGHLIKCGFPPCPGEIMASNPTWRQPFSTWRDYFERWIAMPEPKEVMQAAIFFDFRGSFGDREFAEELRNHLTKHAARQDVFLRYLAANCLETRPPLSFFRNFIVEKNGEHKNTLDIKKRGLVPIVDFARVMALKYSVKETNTLGRLELLAEAGHISQSLHNDTCDAYEFMMQLRLVHQMERYEQGQEPNNHIDPGTLSELDKRTLKEAFAVIGRLQSFLKDYFKLNIG
ncbi:MAG: DUF294 nucleotidyltransferase-like domain-containing protein [Desulfohalobiaceae bacterium]